MTLFYQGILHLESTRGFLGEPSALKEGLLVQNFSLIIWNEAENSRLVEVKIAKVVMNEAQALTIFNGKCDKKCKFRVLGGRGEFKGWPLGGAAPNIGLILLNLSPNILAVEGKILGVKRLEICNILVFHCFKPYESKTVI